eukprot:540058_1
MESVQAQLTDNAYNHKRDMHNKIRSKLIKIFMITGLSIPFTCYIIVLCGVDPNDFYSDTVATASILLTMYAPFLAFYGNSRPLKDQLYHFAILWYYCNTCYQITWEMPWYIFKQKIFSAQLDINHLDNTNKWYWIWWGYGRTDTRYLHHNDLVIAISAWDGIWAIPELLMIYLLWNKKIRNFCSVVWIVSWYMSRIWTVLMVFW